MAVGQCTSGSGTMDLSMCKEQFSRAYVRAVASVAGYNVYQFDVDDDSIDLGIAGRGARGTNRSPRLELQVKCTSQDVLTDGYVTFPLKRKNYDDLVGDNVDVPRILVVVVVPDNIEDWLTHSEDSLVMKRCGYWLSLRAYPETTNTTSVTVKIPRAQVLTVESLRAIMDTISGRGAP